MIPDALALPEVSAAYAAIPPTPRKYLQGLRSLILETAKTTDGVGTLTETLKWGEPSFVTSHPKSGTTLRLAWKPALPDTAQMLVPCSTTLVDEWRQHYPGTLTFSGTRAIHLDINTPLPRTELAHCIAMALTYHARKQTS